MRLIDADEVRKHAVETYQGNGVELEPIMMVPLSNINNAPTVPLPNEQVAWEQGYEVGYAQGYIDGSTGADWRGGAE